MSWMRPGGQQPITWLIKPTEQAEKQLRREAVSAGMAETAFLFLAVSNVFAIVQVNVVFWRLRFGDSTG